MEPNIPLRRSILATPADEVGKVENAIDSGADEVLLDLEDSLAASEKESARRILIEAVDAHDWSNGALSYRINDVSTRWWYRDVIDVVDAVGSRIRSLVVPKVDGPADVTAVETLLEQVEVNAGLTRDSIGLTIQIETAAGMNNVIDIAHESSRIDGIVFGPADYITSIGAVGHNIGPKSSYPGHYWHYPMSRIAHAAASAGIPVIDGPYVDYEDEQGFLQSCDRARMLGYDGKLLIHPKQIGVANDVFSPSREEAERAQRIVDAYGDADTSVASIDGKAIDDVTYRTARRVVAVARKAGIL